MQRETTTFTTPKGKQLVEIYTYITGREKRAITGAYLNMGVDYDVHSENIKGINSKVIEDAQNITIKSIVIAIDGHKEGELVDNKKFSILETILDMHASDYEFVINELNKVTRDDSFTEKKTK